MQVIARDLSPAKTRPRRQRAVAVLLCLVLLAAIGWAIWFWPSSGIRQHAGARLRDSAVPVLVAQSTGKDVPIFLDGLGTVQAYQTVTIRPMIDGPLIEVDFKEGQDEHVGNVLARIDPRPYQAALDQAIAKKAQDQANLANARLDLARYQKLAATAYTSAQQADTQKATVAQLEAQVAQDQAQIDSARTQLSYTTIVAPIDGRTGIRQVDVGNIVHTTDTTGIVVLTQLRPIAVIFTLPQQSLQRVVGAMSAGNAEVLALTQGGDGAAGKLLDRGALSVLDNQVDPTTGTIKLKATFPNADLKLWPGGFVNVRLKVETIHDAIVVPPAAVQRGPNGPAVYVVDTANDTVTRREVTIGHEDADNSIVTAGLQANETVVVDGASRLTDGTKVTITEPSPGATPGASQPNAPGTPTRRARAPSPT